MTRAAASLSSLALVVLAACGGAPLTRVTTTPPPCSPAPQPTDSVLRGGPYPDRPDVTYLGLTTAANEVCWVSKEAAAGYEIEGTVIWMPDCDDWNAGFKGHSTLEFSEILAATRYSLPKSEDPRLSSLKDLDVSVTARDKTGRMIGYDATAIIADPFCGLR